MNALENMSAPPRTAVVVRQEPVAGRSSLFRLGWACWATGLLGTVTPEHMGGSGAEVARERWGGRAERFLAEIGYDGDAPPPPGPLAGYLVGADPAGDPFVPGANLGLCPDPRVTVHVLSRVVGSLYIPHRRPELEWDQLFGTAFFVDEPSLRFPGRSESPWLELLGAGT